MAKKPKGVLGVDYAYKRDAKGNIIGYQPIKGGGAGASGMGKLKTLGALLSGDIKIGALDKKARNQLADIKLGKFDYNKKDLKKIGLTMKDINLADFKSIKGELRDIFADDKVKKPELKGLKSFVGKTIDARELANLEERAKLDTDAIQAAQRGLLATLDMSLFARRAVTRARGIRGAIGTSTQGDAGYGRNLARVSLGAI